MFDLIKLKLLAGNGGNGHISFRREKYAPKGGPDGGDGGDGGNIIFCASNEFSTLQHLQSLTKIQAKAGKAGSKRKRTGEDAQDVYVKVPVGTRIIVEQQNAVAARRRQGGDQKIARQAAQFALYSQGYADEEQPNRQFSLADRESDLVLLATDRSTSSESADVLYEFTQLGQEFLVCQGGFGGRGNTHFKASNLTTPRIAELGSIGEKMEVTLELRLLADVGLVGQPNAGKSTLLSVLTAAKPKIGNYPFTTIQPNLGILKNSQLVIADIPGLVEGASQGKGLGNDFLRHIAHCRTICLLLAVNEDYLPNLSQEVFKPALTDLGSQLKMLEQELAHSMPEILTKKKLVILTKTDLYPPTFTTKAIKILQKSASMVLAVSSAKGDGIKELTSTLQKLQ